MSEITVEMSEEIQKEIDDFEEINLEGLGQVQLLNRIDSKYVFHVSKLPEILREIRENYFILQIEGKRMFEYETLYFDTEDYQLYRFHHNGKTNRLKVRYRTYADTGQTYFEVKYKVKGSRTDKKRLQQDEMKLVLTEEELRLVDHPQLTNAHLKEALWVYFTRITFAQKNFKERITLDINLTFDNKRTRQSIPELVIAEVKQDKSSPESPIVKAFKNRHFEKIGFSKYSSGIALLEDIKSNTFKPNFIKIKKIIDGNS